MKKTILLVVILVSNYSLFAQLDNATSSSNGSMTLGNGTGTLYQFSGAQRGTDNTNQSQGGFGILSGAHQVSPIVWMYNYGERNAFQVRKKGFGSTLQNGETLFHVGVNGTVGIGTTAPKEKLHINGSIRGNAPGGALRVKTTSGYLDLGAQNTSWAHIYTDLPKIIFNKDLYTTTNAFSSYDNDLILKTKGTERLRINETNGNVGIGTTAPERKLHVKDGGALIQGKNPVFSLKDITTTSWLDIGVSSANGSYSKFAKEGSVVLRGYAWKKGDFIIANPAGTKMKFVTGYDTTEKEQMTIDNKGNVGIGTTTPSAKLDVAGTIKGSKALLLGNAKYEDTGIQGKHYVINSQGGPVKITDDLLAQLTIRSSKQDVSSWVELGVSSNKGWGSKFAKKGSVVMRSISYNGDFYITNPGNTGITFATGSWKTQKERMTITNTGNVGIGTLNPDAKLAVNGNIHAKEVTVDLEGWPDYVFEDNYTLPTLQQVEQHIAEKGHLVNIPSATEVAQNGVQLGEMNKLLLEKIEELTLYTIDQEKKLQKMKALENRLAKLEALLLKK